MPANPVKTGDLLGGRYQLEIRIPDAGLGDAWTALDRQEDERPVMVKLLGVGAPGDIADARSLPALVARMKRVEHPDVLPVRAWGDHDDRLYLVHDRFDGRGLAGWLAGHRKARTRPGLATAQRLFDRVAGALQAVREQSGGAHHGALSPRSVRVRREGPGRYDVRVMDFGVTALVVPASGEHPLAPAYRAPEQRGHNPEEGARADVFALAVLLAEVLGPAQTAGLGDAPTWAALALEDPAKVRSKLGAIRSDVPHAVWDLVARALQADPSQRPEHAGEFRALLQQQWKKVGLWEKAALTPEPEPPEPGDAPGDAPEALRTLFGARPSAHVPTAAPASPVALPVAEPLPMPAPLAPLPVSAPMLAPMSAPLPVSAPMTPLAPLPVAPPVVAPLPVAPPPAAWPAPAIPPPPAAWPAPAIPPAPVPGPTTLPVGPPSIPLPVSAPSVAPRTGLGGLGATALGARQATMAPPRAAAPLPPPPVVVEPPTMPRLPHVDTPPDDAPATIAMGARSPFNAMENTSVDVFASLGLSADDITGEDPHPADDPSPTPPEGVPVLTTEGHGFRLGSRLSTAPPRAAPSAAPPARASDAPSPGRSRLRAKTLGADELVDLEHPSLLAAPQPDAEGTRMLQMGWDDGAPQTLSPAAKPWSPPPPAPHAPAPAPVELPASGDPFAVPAAVPLVERTMAIDLSASGAIPAPALPPGPTFPPQAAPTFPQPGDGQWQGWGAPPPPHVQLPPARPQGIALGWIVGGVTMTLALLLLIVVLVKG